ncbi:hypothetical protein GR160_05750 [Flavobacterium sp. Sd200]|uniref:hypothetical protein n=1 Tax=Flavobacterium sp. Sd200 TaxID=2692211 RepID=UPI001371BAB6|nr:hypothetical protein [Flavobacterium sp. Sd200]MXN90724.1 hypothetical protein [Flavobacterium sp. Sd200]
MDTLELRNIVMAQVSQIEDRSLLAALKTILDLKAAPTIILSDAQKREIEASQKEVEAGLFKTNLVLDQEIRQWLEK